MLFNSPEKLRELVLPQVIRRLIQIVLSAGLTLMPTSDLNQSDATKRTPLAPNRHDYLFEEYDLLPDDNSDQKPDNGEVLDSCANDTCQYG